jgi:hypothetical protein
VRAANAAQPLRAVLACLAISAEVIWDFLA